MFFNHKSSTINHKWVVFTDLDGSLLDYNTYSFEPAIEALNLLKEKGIPLCIATSKTRAEIEEYRILLGNKHPFISENGGGIFVPQGYFPFPFSFNRETEMYKVVELGKSHHTLLEELELAQKEMKLDIRPLSLLSKDEVMVLTGLKYYQVNLMMAREYDEPFIFEGEGYKRFLERMESKSLNIVRGGRFFHLMGGNDKGRAVEMLINLYRRLNPGLKTMAIGDSENDLAMFQVVDIPVLVKKADGGYDESILKYYQSSKEGIIFKPFIFADAVGPKGWNRAVLDIIGGRG